jgi:hypothetical protein
MSTLDNLEYQHRKEIRKNFRKFYKVRPLQLMLVSFFVAPFIIAAGCFIPILGQLLFGFSILLTAIFLWKIRSLVAFAAMLLGVLASSAIIILFGHLLTEQVAALFYFLLGFSVAVSAAYIVWISGMLAADYQKAAERYETAANEAGADCAISRNQSSNDSSD